MISPKKTYTKEVSTLMDIVALLETLVKGILEAEEHFFDNPKDFYSLETSVKSTTEAFSAAFLGNVLSSVDKQIYENTFRKDKYNAQRRAKRTYITTVGDITFDCTYYQNKKDKSYHYLTEELVGISKNERMSEAAETAILTEALKTSYEEATKVIPSKQKLTKTTVMDKVHALASEIPHIPPKEKKVVKVLHIEADEDHVAEQHGRWYPAVDNKSFQVRLIYLYESKIDSETGKSRKELVETFYFSGVYTGKEDVDRFWSKVDKYIKDTYDIDALKKVYISGDGAAWIKAGTSYIDKALFCTDKYHLMKYINKASNQMMDEADIAKDELWHILYSKSMKNYEAKRKFTEYTNLMLSVAENQKVIQELQTFVLGNWSAVRRSLRNKNVGGCSAESHVSHILSDRLSSRPMGWSETGADRMSKLRCYERNYGREKIIDLVKYSREVRKDYRTGTDDVPLKKLTLKQITAENYNQARSYIDRIQATIPGITAKKSAAIRHQLGML